MNRKIVVLDGWTLNPGDLSWTDLEELGEVTVYDRTAPGEILPRAEGAAVALTNKVPFTAETIASLPELRLISVLATGVNPIDVEAARRRGIPVSNVPGYSTESVVQSTFAHLLNLASALSYFTAKTREGVWTAAPDFTFYGVPLIELAGKTFGIVGFGAIGKRVAQVAESFGMKVIAYSRSLTPGEKIGSVAAVALDDLFTRSDVVSLHCPLTAENRHMVNRERLAAMKKTAFLINTARGPLVDPKALADALNEGRLAGAGMDVLTVEPPAETEPLLSARNCFITPHNAWATREARLRLMAETVANVRAFFEGKPRNVVNGLG
ncbi:MAG: D-2-hydroxyacid dehydrogenase [Thermoguttaceae bacterium]|nr:D-2-hydroxyacid dehydrogenase [Thermoguttaceae bacterium]